MFVLPSFFVVLLVAAATEGTGVVHTLTVTNGGQFGDWGAIEYCPEHEFAIGFYMKIDTNHDNDDTALNGIQLVCRNPNEPDVETDLDRRGATSNQGPWGVWHGPVMCYAPRGYQDVLTSFKLQVEPWTFHNDDTSANRIKFTCRDLAGDLPVYSAPDSDITAGLGEGAWSEDWSDQCPDHSAICGIQTRVQRPQGDLYDQDDTALNDVRFFCCNQ